MRPVPLLWETLDLERRPWAREQLDLPVDLVCQYSDQLQTEG